MSIQTKQEAREFGLDQLMWLIFAGFIYGGGQSPGNRAWQPSRKPLRPQTLVDIELFCIRLVSTSVDSIASTSIYSIVST